MFAAVVNKQPISTPTMPSMVRLLVPFFTLRGSFFPVEDVLFGDERVRRASVPVSTMSRISSTERARLAISARCRR